MNAIAFTKDKANMPIENLIKELMGENVDLKSEEYIKNYQDIKQWIEKYKKN